MSWVRFEEDNKGEEEKYFSTLLESGVNTITEKQVDPAIEIFKEIKELYPEEPQAYFYLANLHNIKDQKVEALKNYELAWKLGKNSLTNSNIIPYQALFLLMSKEKKSEEELAKWVERAKLFYSGYTEEKRKLIDFTEQMVGKIQ
jgi:tetratricopeptide (TPR) repeat protein